MLLDASPDGGIDRFIFCGELLPPVFSVLLQPVTAVLVAFRVAFPPQRGSPLCIELVQQPLDALKAFVAFDCDMQRLALEPVVTGIEKGDHGRRLAEVTPGGLDDLALPPGLIGRRRRPVAALAKIHALARARLGIQLVRAHVTDPGSARLAPSAPRAKPIWSA